MNAFLIAFGAFVMLVTGAVTSMVQAEICTRLTRIPHSVLRLAALLVPPDQRDDLREEWQAELHAIVTDTEDVPVTGLLRATWYALGLIVRGRAVARELNGTAGQRRARLVGLLARFKRGTRALPGWPGSRRISGQVMTVSTPAGTIAITGRGALAAAAALAALATGISASILADSGARSGAHHVSAIPSAGVPRMPVWGRSDLVDSVAFSPDGKSLACGGWDGTVRVWDVATRRPIGRLLHGLDGVAESVTFSPDGRTLAGISDDGTVWVWDVATGHPIGHIQLGGFPGSVNWVAFSPDGKTLAAGSDEGLVRLWDLATRHPIGHMHLLGGPAVGPVAFSPDGKTLAGIASGAVWLWDLTSPARDQVFTVFELHSKVIFAGSPLAGRPLHGLDISVESVAFSPDGRTLAGISDDGTLRLWDVATGRSIGRPFRGLDGPARSVAFSPDGKILAAGSDDGMVRAWDVATGRPIGRPLYGPSVPVYWVAFSPDGKSLSSGSFDGTVQVWNVA